MLKVLKGATVIDGTGAAPTRDAVVVVDGTRIVHVGPLASAPESVKNDPNLEAVDLTGLTVLPGLINCHEHLTFKRYSGSFQDTETRSAATAAVYGSGAALVSLREGVTTVRDVGAKDDTNILLRDAISEGVIQGPRVYASGAPLSMTGGHGAAICREVDGPDEVRKAARDVLKAGADWVKVMASGGYVAQGRDLPYHTQLGLEELRVAAYEAHNQGKRITAHCHPPQGIRDCIDAGFDCIEHAVLIDEATAALMAEHGTFLVPTVSALFITAEKGRAMGRPDWLVDISSGSRDELMRALKLALSAGIPIAAGPDSIGEMQRELELYVEAGMTTMAAIQTATSNAARLLGEEDRLGTLEVGKLADIIAVSGDPLADISALRDVQWVMKDGRALDPDGLLNAAGAHMHYARYIN